MGSGRDRLPTRTRARTVQPAEKIADCRQFARVLFGRRARGADGPQEDVDRERPEHRAIARRRGLAGPGDEP